MVKGYGREEKRRVWQWRSVAKISGYTGYWFTNRNMRGADLANILHAWLLLKILGIFWIPWCPLRHATGVWQGRHLLAQNLGLPAGLVPAAPKVLWKRPPPITLSCFLILDIASTWFSVVFLCYKPHRSMNNKLHSAGWPAGHLH